MARLALIAGEVIYVNLTTPVLRHTYVVLRAVLVTGVIAIAVGYLDAHFGADVGADPTAAFFRQLLLGLWAIVMLFGLVLPVVKKQRRRIIVSDRRLLLRAPGLRGAVTDIPLENILGVTRHGQDVHVQVLGSRRPLVIQRVPKAKKFCESVEVLAAHSRSRVPYLR